MHRLPFEILHLKPVRKEMSLLNVAHLAFRHVSQAEWLFTDVSFEINPHDRIGLIGPNGTGKTTLLRVLTGELQPVSGAIAQRHGLRIGYIPQEGPAAQSDTPLEEYVFEAHPDVGSLRQELRALEKGLNDPTVASRYANLLSLYEAQGGFRAEAETERVLGGLGLDARERLLPMAYLSSGQRTRAELTKLLLSPADLLLIDEPTNHLDIAAQEWLEGYLSHLDAAYVMVSHDRTFLSRATTRIFELRRGSLTVFEGNYEWYREQRALREQQEWENYEAQQRRRVAAERTAEQRMRVARKIASPVPAKRQNQNPKFDTFYAGKAGKLQRTARILRERVLREPEAVKPWQDTPIPVLTFPNVERTGEIALSVEGLSKAYDGKILFEGLNFSVRRGERLAITGPNGTGKTTLLRVLLGEERPDRGDVRFGAHVKVGYYAQEGTNLDPSMSPLAFCRRVYEDETWVRTILGCLKLRGERVNQPLGALSAGEKGKVVLARILLSGANLLLLDEPTNHLDIEAREAVEGTLLQFPWTILFVSHDRYFIETLADKILDFGRHPAFSSNFPVAGVP
jgi:ATP-binding cassette subfamily F protein 3